MLSANGDTKMVIKGIEHGACDYLLKPVRMAELKIIWQHVIRKKKFGPKGHNNASGEVGQGPNTSGSSEHKPNGKRKDQSETKNQNEVEETDSEDDADESESISTRKKARVVWSVDLHKKFMAAVNHLGVNSKILTVMDENCVVFFLLIPWVSI